MSVTRLRTLQPTTPAPTAVDAPLRDMRPVTPADLGAIDGAPPPQGSEVPPPPMPGTAPDLPDPEGPRATPRRMAAVLPNSVDTDGDGSPYNMYQMMMLAMQIMWESSRDAWDTHAAMKRLADRQRIESKHRSIEAAQDRIRGERVRSISSIVGAVSGATIAAGTGFYGAFLGLSQDPRRLAMGQSLASAGNAMSSVVQSTMQAIDKNWHYFGLKGGGYRADEADIRSRRFQRDEDVAQRASEVSRNAYESLKEHMRRAQQSISDYNDRKLQASSAVSR